MGPSFAHFNGSVNLGDAEAVFRGLSAAVPAARRLTDGETGERRIFLSFLGERFLAADGTVEAPPSSGGTPLAFATPRVALAEGVDPDGVRWPPIGHADFYAESWAVFQRLEAEGVIRPGVRLQCQLATPLTAVSCHATPGQADAFLDGYERALFADLALLLDRIPHERVAIQWDAPAEIGVLEMPERFAVTALRSTDLLAARIARCVDQVPGHIPVGLHLCYGDAGHEHWRDPHSLATQVELFNAVAQRARRLVTWTSFTVPQHAATEQFFEPLSRLHPSLAEPCLALVPYHPEAQAPGITERQVRLVDAALGDRPWGICTECGLSGVTEAELPRILHLHGELIDRFGERNALPATPAEDDHGPAARTTG